MTNRELTPWVAPPTWLAVALTVVLTVVFVVLRLYVFTQNVVPIADVLPLLLTLWHRDRRLLWSMVGIFIAASGYKLFGLMAVEERLEGVANPVIFFGMKSVDLVVAGAVIHLAVGYRNVVEYVNASLAQSNEELQAANEELAAREEEISRQNEELQVQTEEMQQQSEELQAQGEELRLSNEELAARESTLESLLHLSSPASSDDDVLPGVCRSAMKLLGGVAACLWEPHGDHFLARAHAGFGDKGPVPEKLEEKASLARLAIQSGGPVHLRDQALRTDLVLPRTADGRAMRSILVAPVRCGGKVLGALEVYSFEPQDWTDQQASLINWLAAQCGQAWETVRLRGQMAKLNESLEHKVEQRTAELEARTTELRMLASQLATAEHRERRRIAQVLHDELQQLLVAARMRLNASAVPTGSWKPQIESLLAQAIELSRSVTTELSPPILFEERFEGSLQWLARRMKQQQNLNVEVRCEPGAEPPNDDWRVFLFTAVGECLFNIVKHANVTDACVEVKVQDDQLHTIVTDMGCGFELAEAQLRARSGESFGLFSVRERAALLGGYVKVQSAPGNGTRVEIVVPLDASRTRLDGVVSAPVREVRIAKQVAQATSKPTPRTSAMTGTIRILLADDHQMLREGLAGLLEGHEDLEIVGHAGDGEQAVEMALNLRPHIVVMDVAMPRLNGIEATRRLHHDAPEVRVIGMSMHARDEMASAMFEAGAVAYVTKGGPTEQLVNEIRRAAATDPVEARAAAARDLDEPRIENDGELA